MLLREGIDFGRAARFSTAIALALLIVATATGAASARSGHRAPARAPKGATHHSPAKRRASAPAAHPAGPNADVASCEIAYPLDGPAQILDTFGESRDGGRRKHEGTDMMAPRRTPVLAVADGVVAWAHDQVGGRCCDLEIRHDDGWRSRYIHLDNDTPGTDDGQGFGIAPGVIEGARVKRGQVIGWVGDSGNAESCAPHLHFELRRPDGTPVNAHEMLMKLQHMPIGTTVPHA